MIGQVLGLRSKGWVTLAVAGAMLASTFGATPSLAQSGNGASAAGAGSGNGVTGGAAVLQRGSGASAQDAGQNTGNGVVSGAPSPGGVSAAVAVSPGAGWLEFAFFGVGAQAVGCEAPVTCTPSSGGNSTFVGAAPWTFTLSGAGTLKVQDAFTTGDRLEVFDNNVSIGLTSVPTSGSDCGSDPASCELSASSSKGTFNLSAGSHSITIRTTQLAPGFSAGAAYFRVDSTGGGGGSCSVIQNVSYIGGTLHADWTVTTGNQAATWIAYIIVGGTVIPFAVQNFGANQGPTSPPALNAAGVPSIGGLGFLSVMVANPGGVICGDFDIVIT